MLAPGSGGTVGQAVRSTVATSLLIQLTLVGTGILLARELGPVDRGHFAYVTLIAIIAWQLGGLGLPQALTHYAARQPAAAARLLQSVRPAFNLQVAVATVATAVLFLVTVNDRPDHVKVGAIVAVAVVPPMAAQLLALGVLQGLREFRAYNGIRLLRNLSFLILGLILVAVDQASFVVLAVAWGISRTLGTIFVMRLAGDAAARRGTATPTGGPDSAELRSFGRRSLLAASSPTESYRIDQAVVAFFLAPQALGFYVVAVAFNNLPRFLGQAIGIVLSPTISADTDPARARSEVWRFTTKTAVALAPVIAALVVAMPTLIRFFFGEAFADATLPAQILAVGSYLYAIRRVLSDAARGAGHPGAGSIAEVVSTVVALGALVIMVPLFDLEGAAVALSASSAAALAVLVWMVRRDFTAAEIAEADGGPR